MSDFDKEAERQKLREKYERDKEKRKSTQRMSELLLKGATMTNRHCEQCGDPIFRYDGEEFCPTCRNAQVVDGQQTTGDAEATGSNESEAGAEGTADADAAAGTVESTAETGSDSTADGARSGDVAVQTGEAGSDPGERAEADDGTATAEGRADARQPPVRSATSTAAGDAATSAAGDVAGSTDLSEARASLRRSVVRFAREAEAEGDPRRARELLAASREAAETLAALNR